VADQSRRALITKLLEELVVALFGKAVILRCRKRTPPVALAFDQHCQFAREFIIGPYGQRPRWAN